MISFKMLNELTRRNHFSDYLPYFSYNDETQTYYNHDDTIGWIYEVVPHNFIDESTINMLKSLLSIVPDDTVVQFILFADPYVLPALILYKELKQRNYDIIHQATGRFMDFWLKGAEHGIKQAADIPTRFFRSFITIKFPYKKNKNFDTDSFKHNVKEILSGARLDPTPVSPENLLNILRRLFNDELLVNRGYNDLKPINKQIILSETEIRTTFSTFQVGKKIYKSTTPKLFPGGKNGVDALVANQLIGGIWGVASDSEQITTPFIYTLNVYKNDASIKKELNLKTNLVLQQQGFGSLAPSLARKKEEFIWAIDQLDNNTRFVKVLPIIWIYSHDHDTAYQSIARVKRIWEEKGFTMQEDKGILPILFISALPFGLYTEGDNINKIDRDFILQDELTATIAPVQADFQGAGEPILLFQGRKGQLVGIDIFDSHADNYNVLVAASTGSGKCRTDGQILLETGFCDLREIKEGDSVLSDNNNAIEIKPVLKTFSFKNEKTIKIKTKFGRIIQCTPDHRLKVENSTWVHAENLKAGDIIPVKLGCMRFGNWGDEDIGYSFSTIYTEKLPRFITINASKSFWMGFINGVINKNGYIDTERNQIEISLTSKELIDQIRTVLEQGFGIACRLRVEEAYNNNDAYILTISDVVDIKKFTETLNNLSSIAGYYDQPRQKALLFKGAMNGKTVTHSTTYREALNASSGDNRSKNPTYGLWESHACGDGSLNEAGSASMRRGSHYDEVVSVEPAENADVYDIAVADTHNYFADGQINHNSFLVNDIVFNYFAAGDKIRIIDIGGSYKKLARLFNGRFLEFSEDSNIVINPFSSIKNIDDEVAVLSAIIKQMILSSTGQVSVDIAETANTIIKNVIRLAWEAKGNEASIDDLYYFLENYKDYIGDVPNRDFFINTASTLAFNITEFTTWGTYGKWFNGPSTFDISNDDFVVLELEHLKPQKELFKVVTLQIINTVTRDLYLSDRSSKRLIIFDEAWQFLESSDIFANVIEEGYRRARKYRGSFSVVVQSLLDLKNFGMVGDVIRANSAWKFLLASPDFERAKMEKIIDYDEFVMNIIKTVRSNKPKYSEVFIDSPFGLGVVRLIVDKYTYYIFTSDPKETSEIEKMVSAEGISYAEAIGKMVEKYGK